MMNATPFQRQRKFQPCPTPLAQVRVGYGSNNGTANFSVELPSSRVWVRIGVLWVPAPASPRAKPSATSHTLWLAAWQRARWADGDAYPVQNLVGTEAAPLAFPTDTGLYGHFVQVRASADTLRGSLVITGASAVAGTWWGVVTYEPESEMSDEEWSVVQSACAGMRHEGTDGPTIVLIA